MPYLEISRNGKLYRRTEVDSARAAAGVRIRLDKEVVFVSSSAPARHNEWEACFVEQPSGKSMVEEHRPRFPGYVLLEKIGEGGMGVVWKSRQESTGRPVAVKLLSQRALGSERQQKRFEREVHLAARLEHPNIVRIYDSGLQQGMYFYAMEMIDGATLDRYVTEKALSSVEILKLFVRICEAIHFAHDKGVIHRDLKPSNILITADGQPHVLDFGLAKAIEDENELTISVSGDAAGTPAYMSPEQAEGRHDVVNERSDIFSLGVMLYRLLVGDTPHELTGTRYQVLKRIVDQDVRPPRTRNPEISRELEQILLKALARKPEERYVSVVEMSQAMQAYIANTAGGAVAPAEQQATGRRGLWIAAGVAIALTAIGAVVLLPRRNPSPMARGPENLSDTQPAKAAGGSAPTATEPTARELDPVREASRVEKNETRAPVVAAPAAEPVVSSIPPGIAPGATVDNRPKTPAFHEWAKTPPMGWSSYDVYGDSVTEAEVLANAKYMQEKLLDYGWNYVIVDFGWYDPSANGDTTDLTYKRKGVKLSVDDYGRFIPAVNRFPSSAGGKGFKPLADKIHGMGLKFGIHLLGGIPREASNSGLPIEGSVFTANQAGDSKKTSGWCPDIYGIKENDAAQAWYSSVIKQYAAWGVDYVKGPPDAPDIEFLRYAIDKCGRPIVLSTGHGPADIEKNYTLKTNVNLWRISNSLWDTWPKLNQQFDLFDLWKNTAGPGYWTDGDMIPLGRVAIRCKAGGADHRTSFTKDEQTTLMTLWSLAPSPLILGMNLPDNDAWTLSLLNNYEVITVNQDSLGKQGVRIMINGETEVWKKELKDGSQAIGLFNRGLAQANVTLKWDAAKFTGKMKARDLWQRKDLGVFENQMSLPIPAHGSSLLKLSKAG